MSYLCYRVQPRDAFVAPGGVGEAQEDEPAVSAPDAAEPAGSGKTGSDWIGVNFCEANHMHVLLASRPFCNASQST